MLQGADILLHNLTAGVFSYHAAASALLALMDSSRIRAFMPFAYQHAQRAEILRSFWRMVCSHNVAAKGMFVAFVSTTVETGTPEAEVEPGIKLLGPVQEKFVMVSDMHTPLTDGKQDSVFISSGYDATSHFESTIDDVLHMYTRITGEELDVSSPLVEGVDQPA